MTFNEYSDFNDYCRKTGKQPEEAFNDILNQINKLSKEKKILENTQVDYKKAE